MHDISEYLIRQLAEVLRSDGPYPLHEPVLGELEERMVSECIRSGFVSSVGPSVDAFESKLAEYLNTPKLTPVVNCTIGIQVALAALGTHKGDEILVPSFTFAGTANAICNNGQVPHFVDIEPECLGIDPIKLDLYLKDIVKRSLDGKSINRITNNVISAIVVVHCFGYAAKLEELIEVARKYGLFVIEDAAEALGTTLGLNGPSLGSLGDCGVISFNGNKIVTTGGGGVILARKWSVSERCRHLSTTAKLPHDFHYYHDEVGFNARMPGINAALGIAQLERLPDILKCKRELHKRYKVAFQETKYGKLFSPGIVDSANHWLNTFIIAEESETLRDELVCLLRNRGYLVRPNWQALHTFQHFGSFPRMKSMEITESMNSRVINFPSGAQLC